MNRTTETLGNATGQTGWRKTYARNWTPPAQPCGAWGRKMKPDAQTQALQAFGADRQVDKCIEELGELATAPVKYRHGEATAAQVIDELADVEVTTGTLWLLFDKGAIEARIAVKLARLQKLVADQVQAKVQAKPEPIPVKPVLRWEDEGNALVLYSGSKQIGMVEQHRSGRWIGDPFGKPAASSADKAAVIRHVERTLKFPAVPIWPVSL